MGDGLPRQSHEIAGARKRQGQGLLRKAILLQTPLPCATPSLPLCSQCSPLKGKEQPSIKRLPRVDDGPTDKEEEEVE